MRGGKWRELMRKQLGKLRTRRNARPRGLTRQESIYDDAKPGSDEQWVRAAMTASAAARRAPPKQKRKERGRTAQKGKKLAQEGYVTGYVHPATPRVHPKIKEWEADTTQATRDEAEWEAKRKIIESLK